jgi:CotS family spore coat protein
MDEQKNLQLLDDYGFTRELLMEYDITIDDVVQMRTVLGLKTSSGDMILKKFKFTTEELLYSLAAMRYVRQKGFNVPELIPTRKGEWFVEKNGMKFFLMEWIKGQLSEEKPNEQHLSLVTKGIANFHRLTHGFKPPFCSGKSQWGKWSEHFNERMDNMREWEELAKNGNTRFDQMYAELVRHAIEEGLHAVDLLSRSSYKDITCIEQDLQGFCHHDLAHHNILITDQNQTALIDFDYAISDIRTHDLASFILRNMRLTKWDMEKALFILKNYFEVAEPYDGEERIIHAMLRFPQDFFELGHFFYVEKRSTIDRLESRLRKWRRQQEKRNLFLQQFEDKAGYLLKQMQK